jgi:hypothetical protein
MLGLFETKGRLSSVKIQDQWLKPGQVILRTGQLTSLLEQPGLVVGCFVFIYQCKLIFISQLFIIDYCKH